MNSDEVVTISKIMLTADGGCGFCAHALMKQLGDAFPLFKNDISGVLHSEYPDAELDEE